MGAWAAVTEDWDDVGGPVVRPYAVTMGRISPETQLELVALVGTTSAGRQALRQLRIASPESRAIAALCCELHSVAEIGARLSLPVVVVQVLVDDLNRAGLVSVDRPSPAERPSIDLLERVLHGLSRL